MIIWFLFQGLFTFISFMVLIMLGNYSGGSIGMTPLAVLLALSIQLAISIILYFATRKLVKPGLNYIFFIANMILYQLSFVAFSEGMPVMDIFKPGFEGFIDRCYSFSSIISGIGITIFFLLLRLKKASVDCRDIEGYDSGKKDAK